MPGEAGFKLSIPVVEFQDLKGDRALFQNAFPITNRHAVKAVLAHEGVLHGYIQNRHISAKIMSEIKAWLVDLGLGGSEVREQT
jgi:hypothetical protein